MLTRRKAVLTAGAFAAFSPAYASQAVFAPKPNADTPTATVVPGTKPPVLDFGDGLQITCDKSAFLTLWEGKTFWLTFGAGRSSYGMQAQGQAVKYASASMVLLLMTLAFAPDRMVKANGGWRMKPEQKTHWVRGDIKLPGLPYWPITDADLHFGNMDSSALGGAVSTAPGGDSGGAPSVNPALGFEKVDAFSCYIVLKKDMSLDDVRARAQILIE